MFLAGRTYLLLPLLIYLRTGTYKHDSDHVQFGTWMWKTLEKPHDATPSKNELSCLHCHSVVGPWWRSKRTQKPRQTPHWVTVLNQLRHVWVIVRHTESGVWVSFNIFQYLSMSRNQLLRTGITREEQQKLDFALSANVIFVSEALWGACLFKRSNEDTAPTWPRSVSMHLPSCELCQKNSWINVWDNVKSTCVNGMDPDIFRTLYLHVYYVYRVNSRHMLMNFPALKF